MQTNDINVQEIVALWIEKQYEWLFTCNLPPLQTERRRKLIIGLYVHGEQLLIEQLATVDQPIIKYPKVFLNNLEPGIVVKIWEMLSLSSNITQDLIHGNTRNKKISNN